MLQTGVLVHVLLRYRTIDRNHIRNPRIDAVVPFKERVIEHDDIGCPSASDLLHLDLANNLVPLVND